jgi:hypothetical protein
MAGAEEVRALNITAGDDDDQPGIALELTADDLDDIAFSPGQPVEERVARLEALLDELAVRAAGDLEGDMSALMSEVRDRIAALRSDAVEGDAALSATGMDTDFRMDDDDPADLIDDEADEIDREDLEPKRL